MVVCSSAVTFLRGAAGHRRSPAHRPRPKRAGQNSHVDPSGGSPRGGQKWAMMEMLRYVFARVLYTRYCAFELSTRIFASYQRLAYDVHIPVQRVFAVFESRDRGVRRPHWNRVAIIPLEFHPKFSVVSALPRFAGGTGSPSAALSSSLFAMVRSVVDLTTPVLRLVGGAPYDRSVFFASSGYPAWTSALSARCRSAHLLLALPTGEPSPARASWRPCSA